MGDRWKDELSAGQRNGSGTAEDEEEEDEEEEEEEGGGEEGEEDGGGATAMAKENKVKSEEERGRKRGGRDLKDRGGGRREKTIERQGATEEGCPVAVSQTIAINNQQDYTLLKPRQEPKLQLKDAVAVVDVPGEIRDRAVATRSMRRETTINETTVASG